MATKGGLLSDMQLKHRIKAGKAISMSDGGGLIFSLSATGHAAWILRYRHGSQRLEMTLGPYLAIGLSEARTLALMKRAEIAQGRNPIVMWGPKRRASIQRGVSFGRDRSHHRLLIAGAGRPTAVVGEGQLRGISPVNAGVGGEGRHPQTGTRRWMPDTALATPCAARDRPNSPLGDLACNSQRT